MIVRMHECICKHHTHIHMVLAMHCITSWKPRQRGGACEGQKTSIWSGVKEMDENLDQRPRNTFKSDKQWTPTVENQ